MENGAAPTRTVSTNDIAAADHDLIGSEVVEDLARLSKRIAKIE
jgi:hypothetical protein